MFLGNRWLNHGEIRRECRPDATNRERRALRHAIRSLTLLRAQLLRVIPWPHKSQHKQKGLTLSLWNVVFPPGLPRKARLCFQDQLAVISTRNVRQKRTNFHCDHIPEAAAARDLVSNTSTRQRFLLPFASGSTNPSIRLSESTFKQQSSARNSLP